MTQLRHSLTGVGRVRTRIRHSKPRRNSWIAWSLTILSLVAYLAVSDWVGRVQVVAHHAGQADLVAWLNVLEVAATIAFGLGIFAIEYGFLLRPWRWAAQHDALTGLLNQGAFWDTAQNLWSRYKGNTSITMMMADVDHFKAINDYAGHLRGDQVLAHIGYTLSHQPRSSTAIVGRIGGEEFAALWVGVSPDDVGLIVERWSTLVQGIECPEGINHITISIGLATSHPPSVESLKSLAHLADETLYKAKSNGRNRIETAQC